MKRHIPACIANSRNGDEILEGVFLVRVDRAFYRWHPQRPFYVLRLAFSNPKNTGPFPHRAALLHPKSPLETQLVPARFRL